MARLKIRPLEWDDLPQVMEIFKNLPDIFYPREVAYYEADYRVWLDGASSEDEAFYVACLPESPQTIGGTLGYKREPETQGVYQLLRFAVRGDLHGRGIGTQLLRHVESEIRKRSGRLLYTFTSSEHYMDASRAFYEAIGFKPQASLPDYWQDGDGLAILGKRLSNGRANEKTRPKVRAFRARA